MTGTPKKKKAGDDERKQIPLRVSPENWKRIQLAKINSDISLQQIMFNAVDAWLRKNKYDGLDSQDGQP